MSCGSRKFDEILSESEVLKSSKGWKLADFNLACSFRPSEPMTEYAGSRPYVAPEVKQRHYSEKCDLSLGQAR